MSEAKRFYALDSFRGICALFVVVYHLNVIGSFTELNFFNNADLFVDFFFVLSGFVITHAYGARENLDFRKFFILRTFRLLPLHAFMLGIFICLEFGRLVAYQKGFSFNKEPFTGPYAPSEILPNLLLVQSWTNLTDKYSFNYPSWSISIEYYLYMIFAAVSLSAFRHRTLIWGAIAISAFFMLYTQQTFLTPFSQKGLSCFFAGALSYCAFDALRKKINPGYLCMTILELCSLVLIVVVLTSDLERKSMVSSLLFCLVVVLFAFDRGAVARLLKAEFFTFLGKLSYSIYLTHAAILFCLTSTFMIVGKKLGLDLVPMIQGNRYIDSGNAMANDLIALLVLVVVVVFSSFTYRYIEVTGQQFGRFLINRKAAKTQALSLP